MVNECGRAYRTWNAEETLAHAMVQTKETLKIVTTHTSAAGEGGRKVNRDPFDGANLSKASIRNRM